MFILIITLTPSVREHRGSFFICWGVGGKVAHQSGKRKAEASLPQRGAPKEGVVWIARNTLSGCPWSIRT